MSTYYCRPNSVITKGGATTPSLQASVQANLSDNSDSTFVQNNASTPITWIFGLSAASVASDEFVARVGISNRWSQTTGSSKVISGDVYRSTDAKPWGNPGFNTYITTTPVTTEIAYYQSSWSRTDVDSLRYLWSDYSSSAITYNAKHYDIWASVYTIKNADCSTLAAQTWSASTTPQISVPVTCTIGWEAATSEWQNLRKVTVEVRIESGGSGVGTGTLKSTTTQDTYFVTSGTGTVVVVMPDSLANGSYNIYARAIRYREGGSTPLADQYGSWSSAAVLTMSAVPPSSPTLTVTADQVNDRAVISITPISSAGYSSPTIDVWRSNDGGTTFSPVRGAVGVAGTFGSATTLYDYEAVRGSSVLYKARVNATASGVVNTSAWTSTRSITITATDWNLKCPETPSLNILDINIIGEPTETLTEDMGVFRPLDRQYPIVVAGVLGGLDGELQIATLTTAQWTAIQALMNAQKVLLLESPFGWSKFIRITNGLNATLLGTATQPRRTISLQYVQTDAP